MLGLGTTELIVILLILLLLFGAARLPKLAKSIGESATELKKGFEGGVADDKKADSKSQKNSRS